MTKKKKQMRLLATLAGVVILCIAYLLIRKADLEKAAEETTAQTQILSIASSEISALKIENGEEVLLFSYDGSTWKSEDEPETALDQDTMEEMVAPLAPLSAVRELGEAQEDLEAYGLAEPAITVSIAKVDGTELELYFGSMTTDYNMYLKTSQSDEIYTVEGTTYYSFEVTLEELQVVEEEAE